MLCINTNIPYILEILVTSVTSMTSVFPTRCRAPTAPVDGRTYVDMCQGGGPMSYTFTSKTVVFIFDFAGTAVE